ncbi:hypothetical protein E2C01_088507 [Portunus trituberculatus]|uniref:Uncharacterized protein n=1 Tax=Portunus trituberculatus TaxID=210409 RepID=A0A5B7J6D2_PORTR|nr:hypothetical protein [Portunus trituberculatus]
MTCVHHGQASQTAAAGVAEGQVWPVSRCRALRREPDVWPPSSTSHNILTWHAEGHDGASSASVPARLPLSLFLLSALHSHPFPVLLLLLLLPHRQHPESASGDRLVK